MVWHSIGEFLHMGGYALYVWGSVAVVFGFMFTELAMLALRRKAILGHLGRDSSADLLNDREVVE